MQFGIVGITSLSPTLAAHISEPYVDLHPQDALLCAVSQGQLAQVSTRWGSLVARVQLSGEMPRGSVFVPIHWNAQYSSDARVGSLVNPAVDPVSGEPEFKHTPVRVEPFAVAWHGFVLSRGVMPMNRVTWWTRITGAQFTRYELAGRQRIDDWPALARAALGVADGEADWLEYEDRSDGSYRAALLLDGRIEACIFIGARPELPSRAWLSALFAKGALEDADRIGLLVGEPLNAGADVGPTVCSCFGIGRNTITDAIREQKLETPAQITACLRAGGNCGSCVPELRKLIASCALEPA